MKNIRICTVIIGNNLDQFLENLDKAQRISEFLELRVDYIKNLKAGDISVIKKNLKKEAILTCRKKTEGGRFKKSEEERIIIIEKALNLGFGYVDIELSTLEEHRLNLSRKEKTKLIVSHHDFEKTPDEETLKKLIKTMKKHHPDVIKIATRVIKPADNFKLFRLILDKKIELPRIIIGMGKQGKVTRILGPVLGSYLTFASVGEQITAQGQININQLEKIYKLIF